MVLFRGRALGCAVRPKEANVSVVALKTRLLFRPIHSAMCRDLESRNELRGTSVEFAGFKVEARQFR
jgi:hypothetical protein